MKKILLPALLAAVSFRAQAQFTSPIISMPVEEGISRKQIVHQSVTGIQMGQGKTLAGQALTVAGNIKGIMDKTVALHKEWYDGLLQVSTGIRNYRRVQEIYTAQSDMIGLYGRVVPTLRQQGLTATQASSATNMYSGLLQENVGLITELVGVLSANRAKMTDPERMEFINNVADRMQAQHELATYLTNKCAALGKSQRQTIIDQKSVLALMGAK